MIEPPLHDSSAERGRIRRLNGRKSVFITDEKITHSQYLRHQRGRRSEIFRNTEDILRFMRQAGAEGPMLDVGVGTGIGLRFLMEGTPNRFVVYALDADEEMLRMARLELKGLEGRLHFIHADAQSSLPFKDGHFGLVHSEYTLHHLNDPAAAVSEVGRILKTDGHFILIDIDPSNFMSRFFRYAYPILRAVGLAWPGGEAAFHSIIHAPPFENHIRALREEGFEIAYCSRKRIRQTVVAVRKRMNPFKAKLR